MYGATFDIAGQHCKHITALHWHWLLNMQEASSAGLVHIAIPKIADGRHRWCGSSTPSKSHTKEASLPTSRQYAPHTRAESSPDDTNAETTKALSNIVLQLQKDKA